MSNSKLKVVQSEGKKLDELSIEEIVGRKQDLSHLKKPHFADASKQEVPLSAFKKRLLELWNAGNK